MPNPMTDGRRCTRPLLNGHVETVKLLVNEFRADANAKSNDGGRHCTRPR